MVPVTVRNVYELRVRYEKRKQNTMNFSSMRPRRSNPGASSRWWLADVSAIVETMAI